MRLTQLSGLTVLALAWQAAAADDGWITHQMTTA